MRVLLSLTGIIAGLALLVLAACAYFFAESFWKRGLHLSRRAIAALAFAGLAALYLSDLTDMFGVAHVGLVAVGLPLLLAAAVAIVQSARTAVRRPAGDCAEAGSACLFAVGDAGTGGPHTAALARQMAAIADRQPVAAVLLLGDNLLGWTPFRFAVSGRFLEPFRPILERKIPFHAILGNHDYSRGRVEAELRSAFFGMGGRRYYKETFGGGLLAVFAIDSRLAQRSPQQAQWLREELAKSTARWNVLLTHEPMQASAIHHKSRPKLRRALEPILKTGPGIDLVLSGHNHLYERRVVHDGIQHLTVGCGGKLYRKKDFPPDEARVVGYKATRSFLAMRFDAEEIACQAIDETGVVIDAFVIRKAAAGKGVEASTTSGAARAC